MTVLRNDNRWDRSNVVFRDGELIRYDKKHRRRRWITSTTASPCCRRRVLERIPADRPYDLAGFVFRAGRRRDEWRARGDQPFLRDRHAGVAGRGAAVSGDRDGSGSLIVDGRCHRRELIALSWRTPHVVHHRLPREASQIIAKLDSPAIERAVQKLVEPARPRRPAVFPGRRRAGGQRQSHAVNDFRKIAGFEAYAPTDNVSELTARVNDESWESVFVNWLKGSRLNDRRHDLRALRRRRETWRRTSARISCGPCNMPRKSARRSSASSAATAATPPRSPTPA